MTSDEADRCAIELDHARGELVLVRSRIEQMRPGQGRDVREAVDAITVALARVREARLRIMGAHEPSSPVFAVRSLEGLQAAWDLARIFPKPVSISDATWLEFADLLGLPPIDVGHPEMSAKILVEAAVVALRDRK